jgi:hypothetical protein
VIDQLVVLASSSARWFPRQMVRHRLDWEVKPQHQTVDRQVQQEEHVQLRDQSQL